MDDGWLKTPENIPGWSTNVHFMVVVVVVHLEPMFPGCCPQVRAPISFPCGYVCALLVEIRWRFDALDCHGIFLPTVAHASPRIQMSNKNFERTFESQQGRAFGLQTSRMQFLQMKLRVLRSLPPTIPKLRAHTRSNDIGQLCQRVSAPRRR